MSVALIFQLNFPVVSLVLLLLARLVANGPDESGFEAGGEPGD